MSNIHPFIELHDPDGSKIYVRPDQILYVIAGKRVVGGTYCTVCGYQFATKETADEVIALVRTALTAPDRPQEQEGGE